ncbi:MAG: hypothetical protein Kow0069_17550 [Promethearchaeota archaeon]
MGTAPRQSFLEKVAFHRNKNGFLGLMLLLSVAILLPSTVRVARANFYPGSGPSLVAQTTSFTSTAGGGDPFLVPGNLWLPNNDTYPAPRPAVLVLHGFWGGIGKESMNRWAVELAKRGFVVFAIDLPGQGMTTNEQATLLPSQDFEPFVLLDAINYLRSHPAVNGSAVGLLGLSYGAATAAMGAGVLGRLVNATVLLNGFYNFTAWLAGGLLDQLGVGYQLSDDRISLDLSREEVEGYLEAFRLLRGDPGELSQLVIPGTTDLNRSFLRKFDAVECLGNSTPGSVLFVHSSRDNTFHGTNQSGLGYEATPGATYLLVDDVHALTDDPARAADYAVINFLEERLLGTQWEVPPSTGEDEESFAARKYLARRDVALTYEPKLGYSFWVEVPLAILASLVPVLVTYDVVLTRKRVGKGRRAREAPDDERVSGEARADLTKSVILVVGAATLCLVSSSFTGFGVFTNFIFGTCLAICVVATYLFFYAFPEEGDLLSGVAGTSGHRRESTGFGTGETKDSSFFGDLKARLKANPIAASLLVLLPTAAAAVGALLSLMEPPLGIPAERALWAFLGTGLALLSTGFLYSRCTRNASERTGAAIAVSRFRALRGFLTGLSVATAVALTWNGVAYFLKVPHVVAPRTWAFPFAWFSVGAFWAGLEWWTEAIAAKVVGGGHLEGSLRSRLLPRGVVVAFNAGLCALVTTVTLSGTFSGPVLGKYLGYVALAGATTYGFTRATNLLLVERHPATSVAFYPLLFVLGVSFVLHL